MPSVLAVFLALQAEDFSLIMALCAVAGVIAAHLSFNLFDDYFDYIRKRSDYRIELKHEGFRARVSKCTYLTSGAATVGELLAVCIITLLLALGIGILIFSYRGMPVLYIAVMAAALSFFYSAPPLSLSYHGLGELVIGIVFGPLNMAGTYYAACGQMDWEILFVAVPVGLLVMNIVYVHSILDFIPDKKAGNLFAARFLKFAETKKERTKEIYMATYNRLSAYAGKKLESLAFEDITKAWLTGFDTFLQKTSPSKNARNIHLRNIRAVFNEAIDDEITTFYPFRRFKIKNAATPKRSLSVEQLRTLFAFPVEEHARKYLDMFKLIFFLCGINIIDLCNLKGITDGRVEYYRAKTSRLYSIKVEPEAFEIMERYKGKRYLLDILDRYNDYRDYAKRLNDNLQLIGEVRLDKHGKKVHKPMFPHLTTYWARHSWATIAAELDIPKETIAAALGHGGNTVTDIYIDFDRRKIDEANRRVMDWVLYGKK